MSLSGGIAPGTHIYATTKRKVGGCAPSHGILTISVRLPRRICLVGVLDMPFRPEFGRRLIRDAPGGLVRSLQYRPLGNGMSVYSDGLLDVAGDAEINTQPERFSPDRLQKRQCD